jgi:hypothetical protein
MTKAQTRFISRMLLWEHWTNGKTMDCRQIGHKYWHNSLRVYDKERPCGLGILEPSLECWLLVGIWWPNHRDSCFSHFLLSRCMQVHILRRTICICPVMGTYVAQASFFCLSSGYPIALHLYLMNEYNSHTAKYITLFNQRLIPKYIPIHTSFCHASINRAQLLILQYLQSTHQNCSASADTLCIMSTPNSQKPDPSVNEPRYAISEKQD